MNNSSALAVVNEQAEDEGLWFIAETVTEDILQKALRRLHAAVEADASAVSNRLQLKERIVGTNYYLHEQEPCECCKRSFPELHIGKSSAGWCFSLHVIPEEGINSLTDWIARWSKPGAYIVDEYGERTSIEDMLDTITKRAWKRGGWTPTELQANHAERGPEGLARHTIGRHCVGHGETTYDLIPGEFS